MTVARKTIVCDGMTANYKTINQIVSEVTRKFGTDVVLNQTRATDGFQF